MRTGHCSSARNYCHPSPAACAHARPAQQCSSRPLQARHCDFAPRVVAHAKPMAARQSQGVHSLFTCRCLGLSRPVLSPAACSQLSVLAFQIHTQKVHYPHLHHEVGQQILIYLSFMDPVVCIEKVTVLLALVVQTHNRILKLCRKMLRR